MRTSWTRRYRTFAVDKCRVKSVFQVSLAPGLVMASPAAATHASIEASRRRTASTKKASHDMRLNADHQDSRVDDWCLTSTYVHVANQKFLRAVTIGNLLACSTNPRQIICYSAEASLTRTSCEYAHRHPSPVVYRMRPALAAMLGAVPLHLWRLAGFHQTRSRRRSWFEYVHDALCRWLRTQACTGSSVDEHHGCRSRAETETGHFRHTRCPLRTTTVIIGARAYTASKEHSSRQRALASKRSQTSFLERPLAPHRLLRIASRCP